MSMRRKKINKNKQKYEGTLLRVIPSYGRDYVSKKECLNDWLNNIDFTVVWGPDSGKAVSKYDADRLGISIQIRYYRLQRLTPIIEPCSLSYQKRY